MSPLHLPERDRDTIQIQLDAPVRDEDGVHRVRAATKRIRVKPHPVVPDPSGWVGECAEKP